MTFVPFDYQEADLQRLEESNWTGLLNIEMSGGKTPMGVWAVERSGAAVSLVVAPQPTHKSAWIPTFEAIMGVTPRIIGNGTKAQKAAREAFEWGEPGVYLVTPQLLTRTDTAAWSGDMLVLDESHLVANPGKKGQKKIGGYGANAKSGEFLANEFTHRIALSGTALRNKFQIAWGTTRFLWPELDGAGDIADANHYRWLEENMTFTEVYTNNRDANGDPKKVKVYDVEKEPGKLFARMPMVATHFRREACCEFHPNGFLALDAPTVVNEVLDLTPAQRRAIKEMEALSLTYLEENPMIAELPLTQALRIRQMTLGEPTVTWTKDEDGEDVQEVTFADDCKSPILDRTLDLLENDLAGENVVIFTSSQKFAAVGVKRLNGAGIPAFEFSGATRSTRDAMMAEFGTTYRAVVVVLAAGSTGLDGLQKVAKTEIWWDRDLDETTNEQARGRVDRLGGIGQVMRLQFHDDLGISEGKYSDALVKRVELNKSLRKA